MADRKKATPEQRHFYNEAQLENNEAWSKYHANTGVIQKLEDDIAQATIAFGKAIDTMTAKLDRSRQKHESSKPEGDLARKKFMEEFKEDPWQLDFSVTEEKKS